MKKIFTFLFALFALLLTTGSILAANGDYKNNLLKIEISKFDEENYDIGLYTQKIYNEPVKIIKKTDTIYYFLLPETSHSITSVTPNDAVKNVLVKSYPYAGQDLDNSYTKVVIITSKPVNLTTSLRTLDPSISPRLDPIRLARLDKVFERYSERLAENNIPSPLNEFRKTAAVQRPELQSNVDVKNDTEDLIASNSTSLEDYQNKVNGMQAAQKQTIEKSAVKTRVSGQTQSLKQTAEETSSVQKQVSKPIGTSVQKTKPAAVQTVKQPVKQIQKPIQNMAQTKKAAAYVNAVTADAAQKADYSDKQKSEKTVTGLSLAQADTGMQAKNKAKTKPIQNATIKSSNIKESENKTVIQKQAEEFEKQLATSEPVNVEFGKKVAVETSDKNIKAEVVEPIQNAPSPNIPVKRGNGNSNNMTLLFVLFVIFMAAYIAAKKIAANKKKHANQVLAADNAVNSISDIKEFLKKKAPANDNVEITENVSDIQTEPPEDIPNNLSEEIAPSENQAPNSVLADTEQIALNEEEKVEAFNAYMANLTDEDISNLENPIQKQDLPVETEDDEVIAQLYTPIENLSGGYAAYSSDNSIIAESNEILQNINEQNQTVDDDVATIVSSSKLTETRGLYLAKFEGATSLVGYIQDDIYVLYNFGEVNIQDTEIESRLAQENDTDSLYIVKTGGKKLMVKSTPYDMSLEMVM